MMVLLIAVLYLAVATLRGLAYFYGDPGWWRGREREIPLYALLWPIFALIDFWEAHRG